jgi:hypothetical protein
MIIRDKENHVLVWVRLMCLKLHNLQQPTCSTPRLHRTAHWSLRYAHWLPCNSPRAMRDANQVV